MPSRLEVCLMSSPVALDREEPGAGGGKIDLTAERFRSTMEHGFAGQTFFPAAALKIL